MYLSNLGKKSTRVSDKDSASQVLTGTHLTTPLSIPKAKTKDRLSRERVAVLCFSSHEARVSVYTFTISLPGLILWLIST